LPTAPTAVADNGTVINQEQVSRITVGGAPAAGEIYYATIDGTLYNYPAVGGDGVSQVATGLAAAIDADPNVSAVANGVGGAGTIEITADNAGVPFVLTTSVSTGAGGNLGSELIDGHLLLTLCSGDLVGTTITASAVGADTFEFFIDGADQNNGGGAAFVIPAGFPSSALVQIQTWLAADNCIIEYGINVIENEVDGGNIGSSQDICTPGDPAAFTNNVSGSGPAGAIITYYWYIDDDTDGVFTVLPAGPHGETIDYGILAADADFYRETRSDLNGEVCTANSNTINITVGPALNGGTIVNADQLLCDADNNPDQITIAGATADGARIRYQWQNSTVSDAGPWGDIGGATTIAFDPPDNLTQSTWYRRELIYVDAANAELCSEFSDEHLIEILEVSPGTIGNAQTICIGDEPATITNIAGATANTGAAGTPAVVTYQWQQRTAGDIDWVNVADRGDGLNDGTNPTYRPAALAVNTSYRRLAYGTIGATTCPSGTGLVGDTDPVSSSNIILISMAGNVGTPEYIYIDYAGANTGNTQSNPEIIIRDGGKTYNNDFCGDPDGIIIDFDPCPVSGADSYEWRISDLAAGTIDNDGVPTWTPGYSGTFDIEVRAIGCNGPSGWAAFEFTVSENTDIATNPSPPDVLAEQQVDIVRIFGDPEDNEYYTIFIDGKEYRYESADADSSSDVATALVGLITADADAIVTAVANANQITLTSILYGFQNTGNTYPVGRSFLTEVDFEEIAFEDGVVEGNMAVGVTNQTSENVCGTLVGAAPICQITDDTPNTQFFSDASAFQYVEYDLESFPDAASPESIAGVINVNTGEVDWNTGFYGRYNVRVRAFGCDGNWSAWQSQSYDINPGVDDPDFITDTVANPIPTCPPDAGDQTQLVSSANVFWSWDNRDAGTLDFNTGMITWNEDFEGTVIVTATSTECGAPSTSRVIYIRSAPSIVLTSAVNTDLTQEICNTAPALTDITYNILGTATGANVTGLPDGVNGTYATTQQIDEITIAGIADNAVYNIAINGVIYDYTVGVGEALAVFRNRIVAALNPLHANITIAAGAGDGDITLTGINPGEFFHTFVQKVSGAGTIVTTNSQGTGTYTISGAPTEQLAARTRYDFTITTGGSTCDQATQTGILFVNPSDQISLTSAAGTQNQDICNGEATTEVTYKILGATGAAIPALTNFEGLPPGLTPALNTSFALDNQSETVTITSAGVGDELKITINGTEFTSGVLGALDDEGDAGDNLEADIIADAAINALVTVTNDGAGGLIITAQNPGVPFSITTELSTDNGNGASITKENTAGTAEFTITSGVVNMTETSITRYTYTITTNGNLAGCTPAAQISGTFTIFPQESITRNPTADDDAVVGPDFPGANMQTVCPSDDIIGIRYDITGSIDANSVAVANLPSGVIRTPVTAIQQHTLTINTAEADDVYRVIIDGVSYTYTVLAGDAVNDVALDLADQINNDADARVTVAAVGAGADLVITADTAGVPFTVYAQDALQTNAGGAQIPTITEVVNQVNVNYITITGDPDAGAVLGRTYAFTLTTPGVTCTDDSLSGSITVSAGPSIVRTSAAATINQELCVSTVDNVSSLTPITFKVLGASGYDIPALVDATFTGLPTGITSVGAPTNQVEIVTLAAGAALDEFKIAINGIEKTSGVLAGAETHVDAANTLEAEITGDAVLGPLVTIINNGAGGLTITARDQARPFTISVEANGAAGGTIDVTNDVGTYAITIAGDPTVVDPNNDGSYPLSITTYNYTISTTGNGGCDAFEFSDTITVIPSETITRNGTADDDAVVGPDFPGANTQIICPGDTLEGIRYDITGSIDANSVAVANLPSGVIRTPVTAIQQHTLTINTAEADDVYRVIIDGVSYTYTVLAGDAVNDVALDLADQINNDADARVTVAAVGAGADLVITADTAGVPFTVYAQDALQTDAGGAQIPTITEVVNQVNVNYITITGDPDAGAVLGRTYAFTLTTPGVTCTDDSLSGSITVSAGPSIVRTSAAATINQELCVSTVDNVSSLTPITFKVLGASGYDIPALVDATFTGLPTGITSVGAPTNQVEIVTLAAGAALDEFKIAINGIEKTSGVLAGAETHVDAANTLEAEITGDAVLGPLVTIINNGAGGLTITARDQARPFTISVEANGAAGGTIDVTNDVGTYAITIAGDPTVVDPNNDGSYPLSITTYNYTISTTGNGGCDAFEFSDTITVIPSETITRNGTADDDAVVGPDFPGANTQIICPGDTLEGIRYDITGSIDANSVAVANLPSGVIRTPVTAIQQHTLTINTAEADDVYRVIIDGVSYTYTVLAGDAVNDVALDLADQINNDADARVTVAAVGAGADLVITADTAGVPFTVYAQDALQTDAGGAQIPTITEVVNQVNVNYITITGDPDAGAVLGRTYAFTLTTPGVTCTDDSLSGSITVSAGPSIVRTSAAATINQELCVSTVDNVSSLTPITFKVLGASGYDIPALVDATFTGLPTGITSVGAPTNQVEIVTLAAGAALDEFKIAINGIEKTSGVLAGAETHVDAANTLEAEITGDAVLGPLVTIINNGAGGLTITARDQARPFTISVEANGAAGGTIDVTNDVGTYAITIAGDPTVVDPNNDGSYPLSITTYNYTISTTGNGGCDAFEFSDTITVIPSETITRNGTADDDAVVGPDFPGAINQSLCYNEDLEGIRFDLSGGAYDANSPTAVPPAL
jgi:phage tail sheath gpL-like